MVTITVCTERSHSVLQKMDHSAAGDTMTAPRFAADLLHRPSCDRDAILAFVALLCMILADTLRQTSAVVKYTAWLGDDSKTRSFPLTTISPHTIDRT